MICLKVTTVYKLNHLKGNKIILIVYYTYLQIKDKFLRYTVDWKEKSFKIKTTFTFCSHAVFLLDKQYFPNQLVFFPVTTYTEWTKDVRIK